MIVKEIAAKTAIAKSKLPAVDYAVNAYTGCTHKCIYCYAEFLKKFTNHSEEWGEFIDIKIFEKISVPKQIENKYVFISSVTDPYNDYEMKYEKTKQVLEKLKNVNCHVGVLTKSKNVLRDLELFKQFKNIEVGISLNTIDDDFRKLIEPKSSSIEERINVLKTLKANNIKNWLFMSPIFPYISDYKEIIEQTKDFVDNYRFENLNLRSESISKVLNLIKREYSGLYKRYIDIYKKNNYSYWNNLENEIIEFCENGKIKYKMYFHHEKTKKIKEVTE